MIGFNRRSRRHFLMSAGKFALALPFLPSLLPEKAWAGQGKKKFVTLCFKNGVRHDQWDPFLKADQIFPDVRMRSMSDFRDTGVNKIIGTGFSPYLNKMTFIKGLDIVPERGHNPGDAMLGNFTTDNSWDTIDQVLAYSNQFYLNEIPAIPSLHLSVGSMSGMSARWSGGRFAHTPFYRDPNALFDRIFFSSSPEDKNINLKIVDRALASYTRLRNSSRLSTDDKRTVQNYMDLLNQTENRIRGQRPLAIGKPATAPTFNPASTKDRYRVLNDLIVLALMAEATQVVTIDVTALPLLTEPDGFPDPTYPRLDSRGLWHEQHHTFDNDTGANSETTRQDIQGILTYNKWQAEHVVLDLVKKMDAATETNGKTLLDNSLVYWGNEIAYGVHAQNNMPIVLFGSAGGAMTPGRFLNYCRMDQPADVYSHFLPANADVRPGRMYNQFLVSVLQTMGMTPQGYERKGQTGYGVLKSLRAETNKRYADVFATHDQMLPRFKS